MKSRVVVCMLLLGASMIGPAVPGGRAQQFVTYGVAAGQGGARVLYSLFGRANVCVAEYDYSFNGSVLRVKYGFLREGQTILLSPADPINPTTPFSSYNVAGPSEMTTVFWFYTAGETSGPDFIPAGPTDCVYPYAGKPLLNWIEVPVVYVGLRAPDPSGAGAVDNWERLDTDQMSSDQFDARIHRILANCGVPAYGSYKGSNIGKSGGFTVLLCQP